MYKQTTISQCIIQEIGRYYEGSTSRCITGQLLALNIHIGELINSTWFKIMNTVITVAFRPQFQSLPH